MSAHWLCRSAILEHPTGLRIELISRFGKVICWHVSERGEAFRKMTKVEVRSWQEQLIRDGVMR